MRPLELDGLHLMGAVLTILLLGQLSSFEFQTISSPHYAGDSFTVTIVARDSRGALYPYNGEALLSTTRDNYWSYIYPRVVVFRNGVCDTTVIVTLASNLAIRCTKENVTGQSNSFDVFTGPPFRLLVMLPGESLAPGSPAGRLPRQPSSQVAGDNFVFTVYLTDIWFNPVGFRSDSVYFSCTDTFAQLPPGGTISNGSGRFTAAVRQAGTHRLVALPSVQQPFRPDTSSEFTVVPGQLAGLLEILPGEYHLPGDVATEPWQTPGKGGRPVAQYVREPFQIAVYPVDRCWNLVTAPNLRVRLHSDFSFSADPPETTLVDAAVFSVEFLSPGPNQNTWATATPGSYESYRSHLEVRARGHRLDITKPDTVDAGETANVTVTVRDANGDPIVATVCRFTVVKGNGTFVSPAMLTDTLGTVTNQFVCTRGRFAEHDSFLISSGRADTFVGIY
ncbi:MAG: Ig-like domain-containing protein, partial [candidate division WOR-3 bacterium]